MTTISRLFDLTGKTAVVTGASYGLGVTFAEALAGQGANVVLAARSEDKLREFCSRLATTGHNAIAVKCDVSDSTQVKGLRETAVSFRAHRRAREQCRGGCRCWHAAGARSR